MILRLTAKLGKKIGYMPTQTLAPDENPFADWVGNVFTAQRAQYIILSNSASLYSIILRGQGITDDCVFIERAKEAMDQFMREDGLEFIFYRLVVPHLGIIRYSKAGDRRVLGSMNDLIHSAKFFLTERQTSPFETALLINDTPLSYLQYNSPRECVAAMTPEKGNTGLIQYQKQKEQERKIKRQNRLEDNAMAKWESIPQIDRTRILEAVWCGGCSGRATMVDYDVRMEKQDLILSGSCAKCGHKVVRVVEGD
jgi:hypothetical protein